MTSIQRATDVPVRGTTLHVEHHGAGRPLLLIHGGGEDAAMLRDQAEALADAGYHVLAYDRRGTGRSGRQDWPGGGADQHADDAAALLVEVGAAPATVLGVSSGGVVALALAARHPELVGRVVAWEPPAVGVLEDGAAITAAMMAPVDAHLADQPEDFVGAQAILLSAVLGFPVSNNDPAFAATRANAEPMIRDEPAITTRPFTQAELSGVDITIAVGTMPIEPIRMAAERLAAPTGREPVVVAGDHEIYFTDPSVLAGVLAS
jgi:pimeloyl-ACP methyl ester carboxylesterase